MQSKHCYFQTFPKLNSTFTFTFITLGCHSYHKVSCQTKVPVSVYICVVMLFQSLRSLIDKQVKRNVLTAKKYVHAHSNSKHWNNKLSISFGLLGFIIFTRNLAHINTTDLILAHHFPVKIPDCRYWLQHNKSYQLINLSIPQWLEPKSRFSYTVLPFLNNNISM